MRIGRHTYWVILIVTYVEVAMRNNRHKENDDATQK